MSPQSQTSSSTKSDSVELTDPLVVDVREKLDSMLDESVVVPSVQENYASDNIVQDLSTTEQFDETSISNLGSTDAPHSAIRKRATKSYLLTANKRMKLRNQHIEELFSNCAIGDYVGIKIDKVDRTNTDPKILPSIIVEKFNDKIKVACIFGIINHLWPLTSIVKLTAVPEELVQLKTTDLKPISIITASKLFVRGAINGITCSYKGACKNKQCACKKNNTFCSTKGHKSGSCCKNQE